jgi:hypothetical protein
MELGGKLLNSLRIKIQFLERLQSVNVVDGATHTQEDDVESNGGSLENVAEIFLLFLCDVQLVLRSGVFTILDLDEVDVTPNFAEVFRSVLSGVGGSTGGLVAGGAARVLPVSLNCPLPLRRTHPPTLVCCVCVFAAMGVTSTKSGRLEVNLPLHGKRGEKSHLGTILLLAVLEIWRFCMIIRSLLPMSMETTHDPKEPVLLIAIKIMRHAKLCISVIMLRSSFACVGTQKDVQGTVYLWAEGASLTC